MNKENGKKSNGCGCFIGVVAVALIAIIITVVVLYSMNPEKLQQCINDISQKAQTYIGELSGNNKKEDNLQFPDEETLDEAQRYYYYQQLSDTAKKIYVSIENNIEKLKDGEDNIPLPPSLNDVAKSSENGKEIIATEFQNAWDAFIGDKSEYFYIDSSKVCLITKMTSRGSNANYEFYLGKGDNKNYFIDEFDSKQEVDDALEEIERVKKKILSGASGNNYEKMKYVHDWLVSNVKYDTTNGDNASNIYGCLVNKNVVCEGYARAFKYLLDELDIPCVFISGMAIDEDGKTERHAWNYVYIKNNWYAVDTTWDDPIIIGSGKVNENVRYKYFLKGKSTMNKDHTPNGRITLNGFVFSYPELSYDDIK